MLYINYNIFMKLNLLPLTFFISVAVFACTSSASPNYTVDLTLDPSLNGQMAYIVDFDSGARLDSAIVSDGRVRIAGNSGATPVMARLLVGDKRAGMFILEPGTISIDPSSGIPSGTPLNARIGRYAAGTDSIEAQLRNVTGTDSVADARRRAIIDGYKAYNDKTIAENADNPLGYYVFLQQAYDLTGPELRASLARYPGMASYKRVQRLVDAIARQEATGVGKQYTDFAVTYDGTTRRLSDYVGRDGQWLLVDFWASWCGPCIRETRTIRKLYEKYGNGKGLNVLGVAVWDKPEDTARAIKAHSLPWENIIDAQTIPTDIYGIPGIPCILLIDPQGKIVSRGKQGADLEAEVERQLQDYTTIQ